MNSAARRGDGEPRRPGIVVARIVARAFRLFVRRLSSLETLIAFPDREDGSVTCHELARKVQQIEPSASPQDVARMCLLLTNSGEDLDALQDAEQLKRAWMETGMRLQAITDQHAAMTLELNDLARSNPQELQGEQIWVLLRAIKVQSQILQMYVGHPMVDV